MMDNLQLTNMNGRIYSQVGQFYSPDPIVQEPTNTQSFNRYAYALNNPLSYLDPSGFCWEPLPSNGGNLMAPGFQVVNCPPEAPPPALVIDWGQWEIQPKVPSGVVASVRPRETYISFRFPHPYCRIP
jgi:RHS repeat-associated protein